MLGQSLHFYISFTRSLNPCVFLHISHCYHPLFFLSLSLFLHRHCQSACLKFETNINGALRSVMDGWATGRTQKLWIVEPEVVARGGKCIQRDKNGNVPSSRSQDLTRITESVYFSNGTGKHIIVDVARSVFLYDNTT